LIPSNFSFSLPYFKIHYFFIANLAFSALLSSKIPESVVLTGKRIVLIHHRDWYSSFIKGVFHAIKRKRFSVLKRLHGIWLDWSSVAYVTIRMYNKLQLQLQLHQNPGNYWSNFKSIIRLNIQQNKNLLPAIFTFSYDNSECATAKSNERRLVWANNLVKWMVGSTDFWQKSNLHTDRITDFI